MDSVLQHLQHIRWTACGLTMDFVLQHICWIVFGLAFAFRYTRLLVGIYANLTYQPYPVAKCPRYSPQDVTIIVPSTFRHPKEIARCLKSMVASGAAKIIVVTADASLNAALQLCISISAAIEVRSISKLNKREQLIHALQFVMTETVFFVDDNVVWSEDFLSKQLAIFEDAKVGAGGPCQRVRRNARPDIWNYLAIGYLERRVFNNITTQAIDGSISTLSGRTQAIRTSIVKTAQFSNYFLTDSWAGHRLNSDDDKCLTRYIYANDWKIAIQRSARLETTMESGWGYVAQCKRWARSHWRGNFIVMSKERYWYSWQYIWGFYAIYLGQFQTPSLLVDASLLALLNVSFTGHPLRVVALRLLVSWIFITKLVKMIPHFIRYPKDLVFVPASILFSYIHGFINIFALLTLQQLTWGSQPLTELERAKEICERPIDVVEIPYAEKNE